MLSEGISLTRVGLWLALVAAVFGFLGWFLIGRHAGQATAEPGDQLDATGGGSAQAEPQIAPGPGKPETNQQTPAGAALAKTDRKASLQVLSDPAGAAVFIDEEHRGITPTHVRGLDPNAQFEVRIELEGHKPWSQVIGLDGHDLEREIQAGLQKIEECKLGTGFIYLTSKPPGATVELNGKRLPGKTPKVINDVCAMIPLRLRVESAGYRDWRGEVRIKPNDIHNLEVVLQR